MGWCGVVRCGTGMRGEATRILGQATRKGFRLGAAWRGSARLGAATRRLGSARRLGSHLRGRGLVDTVKRKAVRLGLALVRRALDGGHLNRQGPHVERGVRRGGRKQT